MNTLQNLERRLLILQKLLEESTYPALESYYLNMIQSVIIQISITKKEIADEYRTKSV